MSKAILWRAAVVAAAVLVVTATTAVARPSSGAEGGRPSGDGRSVERLCAGSEEPRSRGFDAATRRDREFNAEFRHCFRTVDGVQMHAVVGGSGPVLVLLHGWPQTWFEWRGLLPALAEHRTVVAVDLPGLGDSTGPVATFEKAALAERVREFVRVLGYDDPVELAAHDLGAGVAWAYARQHPSEVVRLAVQDFPLPSPACPVSALSSLSYHFALFREEDRVAELLVDDEVGPYLRNFFRHVSPDPEPVSEAEAREFTRTYARPANLTNGFELYRTLDEDEAANTASAAQPFDVPLLVLTQDGSPAFDAYAALSACYTSAGATSVTGRAIPGTGHWLNEEAPDEVLADLGAFFGWSS